MRSEVVSRPQSLVSRPQSSVAGNFAARALSSGSGPMRRQGISRVARETAAPYQRPTRPADGVHSRLGERALTALDLVGAHSQGGICATSDTASRHLARKGSGVRRVCVRDSCCCFGPVDAVFCCSVRVCAKSGTPCLDIMSGSRLVASLSFFFSPANPLPAAAEPHADQRKAHGSFSQKLAGIV